MAPARSIRRGKAYGGDKNWSDLKPDYRARLARQGITREAWIRGDSLSAARGHAPKPPKGAAPAGPTEAIVAGEATMDQIRKLEDWAERQTFPKWIPADVSVDTKAALSQIDLRPEQWGRVRFLPRGDDQPWEMIITPKGARTRADGTSPYDRQVQIPGGGGRDTQGAREVLDWLTFGDDAPEGLDWDVEGTV